MKTIQAIPINNKGDLLFIKDFHRQNERLFLSYKSMLNDMPFQLTEVYIDTNSNVLITGTDGTVLYRFPVQLALKTTQDEK